MFGGAGVGKTVIVMELINNIAKESTVVFSGFRRCGRAHPGGNDLLREMTAGVLIR